jgi:hypothetical protein
MPAAALAATVMVLMTVLTGYVYFRWQSLPVRGDRPYTRAERGIALLAFISLLLGTLVVLVFAVTHR